MAFTPLHSEGAQYATHSPPITALPSEVGILNEKMYKKKPQKNNLAHSPLPREKKYVLVVVIAHGEYNKSARPYKVNPYAAKNFHASVVPVKIVTYANCPFGGVLIGELDGSDNQKLFNYFKINSGINLMPKPNVQDQDQDQDQDQYQDQYQYQVIAENFLNYAKNGLATLKTNPRDKIEQYRIKNKEDNDVCRNSYMYNNKVGITNIVINKTYSTDNAPTDLENRNFWGVFVFNNNCDIKPGTPIEQILPEMTLEIIRNGNGENIGVKYELSNIINSLIKKYSLNKNDVLLFFDYSCNSISSDVVNQADTRAVRCIGNGIAKSLGFKASGTKRKRGGSNKKTKKNSRHRPRR